MASCAVDNDDALFVRLTDVTRQAIARVHDDFDYREAVQTAWKTVDMAGMLDADARAAGQTLRKEWGPLWVYLTGYGVYAEKAANEIANRVFASDAFKQKVQAISEIAILQLGERFAEDEQRLSEPLQFCLTEYLEANYAPIIHGAARSSFTVSADVGDVDATMAGAAGTPKSFAVVLTGIILIVTRRITRRIAARVAGGVARRVTAKVASRFIPIIGWLLLAYEVLFQTTGAIPAIVKAVHDEQVVVGLQSEIANELRVGMAGHLGEISDEIVSDTMAQWRAFQRAHTLVLGLSESNPRFASFLKAYSKDDDVAPITLGVSRVLEIEGETKLNDLIDRGRLGEFVNLSDAGIAIARDLQDVDVAMGWARVAGARLGDVAAIGLYRLREPDDLKPVTLSFLLDIKDHSLIATIAALPPKLIEALPRFGPRNVRRAAEIFSTADLQTFVFDLISIDAVQARNIIWSHLPDGEGQANDFLSKVHSVRASRDQTAAADILFTRVWGLFAPHRIATAVASVWSGDVSWTVIRERYSTVFLLALGIVALIALWLLRLILPLWRRKRR